MFTQVKSAVDWVLLHRSHDNYVDALESKSAFTFLDQHDVKNEIKFIIFDIY